MNFDKIRAQFESILSRFETKVEWIQSLSINELIKHLVEKNACFNTGTLKIEYEEYEPDHTIVYRYYYPNILLIILSMADTENYLMNPLSMDIEITLNETIDVELIKRALSEFILTTNNNRVRDEAKGTLKRLMRC